MLELQQKFESFENEHLAKGCLQHNIVKNIYCETCHAVICSECTVSKEHNTHKCHLISECYPKHRQELQNSLDLVKHKLSDIDTAVTKIAKREREVLQQGEDLKEKINTHAQLVTERVEKSRTRLSEQVDTAVKLKTSTLATQKQVAETLHARLKTCEEIIEQSLKELTQQQILMAKYTMAKETDALTQNVQPSVFQPAEEDNIKFIKNTIFEKEIGFISHRTYEKATLELLPCELGQLTTATLTLQSQDGTPFPLPPSLISSTLSSPGVDKPPVKCDITQTHPGEYSITFTPSTRHDQLVVQVGGVDIPDSPFTLPVMTVSPKQRDKPVNIITGINMPRGIAVCANGGIVVVESGSNCVTIFNKFDEKVRSLGNEQNECQFTSPHGLAITANGHVLVTDNHRLQKLTVYGKHLKSVGSEAPGSGQLEFNSPHGITVHPSTGQIFVADIKNNRIQVFNDNLTFSHTIVVTGRVQFELPYDVALDNDGFMYIPEWSHGRIMKLTCKGRLVKTFGTHGTDPGELSFPSSLVISNNNLVYVTERGNDRVSIFDTKGKFVHCFGKTGREEGELYGPRGITIDRLGNLYISDSSNNRVVVY